MVAQDSRQRTAAFVEALESRVSNRLVTPYEPPGVIPWILPPPPPFERRHPGGLKTISHLLLHAAVLGWLPPQGLARP
jgi:hypothetical protein